MVSRKIFSQLGTKSAMQVYTAVYTGGSGSEVGSEGCVPHAGPAGLEGLGSLARGFPQGQKGNWAEWAEIRAYEACIPAFSLYRLPPGGGRRARRTRAPLA